MTDSRPTTSVPRLRNAVPSRGELAASGDAGDRQPVVPAAPRSKTPDRTDPPDHPGGILVARLVTGLGVLAFLLAGLVTLMAMDSPPPHVTDSYNGLAIIEVPPLLLATFLLTGAGSLIYGLCGAAARSLIASAVAVAAVLSCGFVYALWV